jgi:hypothetical protein
MVTIADATFEKDDTMKLMYNMNPLLNQSTPYGVAKIILRGRNTTAIDVKVEKYETRNYRFLTEAEDKAFQAVKVLGVAHRVAIFEAALDGVKHKPKAAPKEKEPKKENDFDFEAGFNALSQAKPKGTHRVPTRGVQESVDPNVRKELVKHEIAVSVPEAAEPENLMDGLEVEMSEGDGSSEDSDFIDTVYDCI